LLGRSSLPFASLQTLKTLRWGIRLPGFKHLKVLKPSRSLAPLPPSPLAASLCCSRVAACPLPALYIQTPPHARGEIPWLMGRCNGSLREKKH